MMTIEVDGRSMQAREDETILSVLRREGVRVPTLCHVEGLPPTGACRLCLVELEGAPGLVPSCSFPVAQGMKVRSNSAKVLRARRTILELLLADHPDDCLYCPRNSTCELRRLAEELGVRERRYHGRKSSRDMDVSSPSIIRDPDKCVLCGKCVRICEEVQGVAAIDFIGRGAKTMVGTVFNTGLNLSSCVNCGQCILACPTGALSEHSYLNEVVAALSDPTKTVVVQHAPAVSVTLAEEFGLKPGKDVDGKMVGALRQVGFRWVFDTSFTADLTIMEEGSELVERIKNGGTLPLLSSCSPGWIKFVEQFYPEFIPNLSTCKSPQQMLGALIKTYFAEKQKLDPANIVSVSIMPCTAKKFECSREEMGRAYVPDVDYALTTRELGSLLRMFGVDLLSVKPDTADTPFGERSGAGKIFGASGGVMEAAIRSAHFLLTGRELDDLKVEPVRGFEGLKEAHLKIDGLEVGVAVANGLGNARRILDQLRQGRKDLQFIEVMTCPGGCIAGGGQPLGADINAIKARMQALYRIDREEPGRLSHRNKGVNRLYEEFLGQPLGEVSHRLLHTHYGRRDVAV